MFVGWRCEGAGWFGFFFFNDTATTEIYTLSLHDALPILDRTTARKPNSCAVVQCFLAQGFTLETATNYYFLCLALIAEATLNRVKLGSLCYQSVVLTNQELID